MATLRYKTGFTLAELLIALVILGVIATFTIPKVLSSQSQARETAIIKESAAMLSGAYDAYRLNNTANANTTPGHLTPYMNYVKVETSLVFDEMYAQAGTKTCSAAVPCLKLHNGGLMRYYPHWGGAGTGNHFGVANNTHFLAVDIDPDGKLTDTSASSVPGKSIGVILYYDGRLTTCGNSNASHTTYYDGVSNNLCGTWGDPSWFKWN